MNIITCSEMENAGVSGAQTRRIDFELQFELFVKMVDIEDFVILNDREFFIFCINFSSIYVYLLTRRRINVFLTRERITLQVCKVGDYRRSS